MGRTKKLTPTALNKLSKAQKVERKITVLNGEYGLTVYDVFEQSKIEKVIYDYTNIVRTVTQNEEVDEDFYRGMAIILNALIVREFTDVELIPETGRVSEILPIAREMYDIGKKSKEDLGLLMEIISKMDQGQLKRLNQQVKDSSEEIGRLIGEFSYKLATAEANALFEVEERSAEDAEKE